MNQAKLLKYLAVLALVLMATCVYLLTLLDSPPPTLEPDDVSDHFPVWAWFYTNMDME